MRRLARGVRRRCSAALSYAQLLFVRAAASTVVWLVPCAAACVVALAPSLAAANDFEEFEAARTAYEDHDYAKAVELFDSLVGDAEPRLQNRSLVLESRKYLGTSYLFLGKLDLAEREFERLLRMDPAYVLDPLGFPEEVQRLFSQVKTRLEADRVAAEAARILEEERLRNEKAERARLENERWLRLSHLAQTEQVTEIRSRWLAMVPFGVGQFQNGHSGLGLVLAVSEVSLLAIATTTYFLHDDLRGQKPSDAQIDDARVAESALRYTNQISLGLLAVVAVTGIIDAQLRFAGTRHYERKRPLPPDLYGGPQLSLGPGGAGMALRF